MISWDFSDYFSFEEAEKWFQGLKQPTLADMVHYEAAKLKESARKKQMENRKIAEENPISEDEEDPEANKNEHDDSIAKPNMAQSSSSATKNKPSARRKRNPAALSAAEKKKSMQFGLNIALNETLESLLSTNFVDDANTSAALGAIPSLPTNTGDKDKALAELVGALPHAEQRKARSDKRQCVLASRKFSPSAKVHGKNGWKVQGMKTTLYHYQLLGASFMRERELCTRQPFGGLLCDTMGFGKTIQALANVVDGRNTQKVDSVNSTLIVVPSHLVEHWRNQIKKHCDGSAIGEVILYRANSRLDTLDSPKSLQKYDVVVTTYDEVRRSYPPVKGKPEGNEVKIREWWEEVYEKQAGPLHRIRFLRIILDEGHLIKNHLSQTSIAVRALTGHYKWVLSGTPVQNYVHEFYPIFDFLEVPGNGTFEAFFENYCKNEIGRDRLLNMLRSFMFRRTHASRLFSLPVVNLPKIQERIISTEFCAAERAIYDAIVATFFNNINGLSNSKNPKLAQHQCILTMMQKLRMICSHILTMQSMVKELLPGKLMETLTKAAQNCGSSDKHSAIITSWLRAMAINPFPDQPKQSNKTAEEATDEPRESNPKLVQEFHQLMSKLHEEERWEERLERTNCPRCRLAPVNPVITSCMHLYCEECYYLLDDQDKDSSNPKRECIECQEAIKAITPGVPVEDIDLEKAPSAPKKKRGQAKKAPKPRAFGRFGGWMFGYRGPRADGNTELDDQDEEPDWIPICAKEMPSAKLTKIRELILGWIAENPKVKIVVFTQFIDFVRILAIMCYTQGWPHAELTGKMRPQDRVKSVEKFREQENMSVFIISLKAGGTGLDMPMANKCILVDLWWNEAIQDQAVARIYRIGQENDVEYVKLIVKDTIDAHLLELQKSKTFDISDMIGNEALEGRASIIDLLRIFADVQVTNTGAINVTQRKD
ncbi:hypothetical protein P170DRAFT_407934 [Aspergillus steynii IBT 23096]|uniref:SNF2 family helicase n=1 Tax=Aspergillus steynii IBT 23096 TaxID=1392250 RepID=A0A2I2G816_9EURO|nr:uncharacterized protein P170DRAFT_407934 [Aspergillus steynii IBT 23096]PLB49011.1 hypothetical protein P170DRAFT_407934 [Aspergillus steynii IBT 23096]